MLNAPKIQDAFHYALRAAGSGRSVFDGIRRSSGDYVSRSVALRMSVTAAREAGIVIKSARRLADADALLIAIEVQAEAGGIDAYTGEHFLSADISDGRYSHAVTLRMVAHLLAGFAKLLELAAPAPVSCSGCGIEMDAEPPCSCCKPAAPVCGLCDFLGRDASSPVCNFGSLTESPCGRPATRRDARWDYPRCEEHAKR